MSPTANTKPFLFTALALSQLPLVTDSHSYSVTPRPPPLQMHITPPLPFRCPFCNDVTHRRTHVFPVQRAGIQLPKSHSHFTDSTGLPTRSWGKQVSLVTMVTTMHPKLQFEGGVYGPGDTETQSECHQRVQCL